jgi:imidazolonepropionase-like amidohydrolase
MEKTLFLGASVWDGSGAAAYRADVLVEGGKVKTISRNLGQLNAADARKIDASGQTLIPGMVEGHSHLSFDNITSGQDLGLCPPEEQTLTTARNAKKLIDAGFTSCFSAGSAKMRLDVAVRNEVNKGNFPGPRIRACSPEIVVTGGLGDDNLLHYPRLAPSLIADGVDEITKTVRLACREGVDNIKLDVSGDPFTPQSASHETPMSFEEIKAAVDVAHGLGRKVVAHSRSAESVKRCLRAGVDVLYHCELMDSEAFDMLEAAKDKVFVGPTVGLFHTMVHNGARFGLTPQVISAMGVDKLLEENQRSHTEMRKRGIRHVIGGDYGLPWNPQGSQAKDIGYFVKYFGYTPAEALKCATWNGGQMMAKAGDAGPIGKIEECYLADLVLVDGDPVADLTLLNDTNRLTVIMKEGSLHKDQSSPQQRKQAAE